MTPGARHGAKSRPNRDKSMKSGMKSIGIWRSLRFFPHPLAWVAAAAMAAVDMFWLLATDMKLENFSHLLDGSWLLIALILALLARFNAKGALAAAMTALFFLVFGTAARVLNHLAASAGMPFVDPWLARMDAALGLDKGVYLALVNFMNSHDMFRHAVQLAYMNHTVIFVFVILFLAATGRMERLRAFTLVFAMTVGATLLLGGLFPAAGAFTYYHPGADLTANLPHGTGNYFVPYLLALNAGTMTTIDMTDMPGLVSMPSYHTIMALMVPWALRRTWAFLPGLIYGALTIAATPVLGGHYFVDLLAGAVTLAASLWLLERSTAKTPAAASLSANPAELPRPSRS